MNYVDVLKKTMSLTGHDEDCVRSKTAILRRCSCGHDELMQILDGIERQLGSGERETFEVWDGFLFQERHPSDPVDEGRMIRITTKCPGDLPAHATIELRGVMLDD